MAEPRRSCTVPEQIEESHTYYHGREKGSGRLVWAMKDIVVERLSCMKLRR